MAVWGKLSKCCCFPLAGGCTAAAIFHFIACLACIFTSEQNYKVWTVVSSGLLGCLIVLGLILKNFIIFYIVAIFTAINVCFYVVALVFLIIALFALTEISIQSKVFIIFIIFALLLGEAFFLNLYLSICKVFKAGGTGWEFKNYMEIENDMQKEKKKKEKEDAMKHNDYNA
ncbi:hypothetical protein MKS88_002319 [Plasmodium brasilianum]|uniref:Uncharacterized protein n=1 Tax=Plasmodium brasilianum TaxID=5824 RepID=A0ACB9YB33_PLABR|nr:hypothetical protein MKS88_002319 [Plasmodium brasilianum]